MFTALEKDTIVAPATGTGAAAISVIRLSGPEAITIVSGIFKGKDLDSQPSHTVHYGTLRDGDTVVDEVVVTLFRAPKSYTGEEVVELSCHGSSYIRESVLNLLTHEGARLAKPGEFTQRAFINGKLDLSQAEAVADLIASESESAHRTAMHQMRGGFSKEISKLREALMNFASLIELELDFAEEDVEFADRSHLEKLLQKVTLTIRGLIDSFRWGNVIKNGVPVAIVGKPNAGKSTLLNALLREDKAIVSDIPGTTRDAIEDELTIEGVRFRFIDTAGLRETADTIEAIGVQRSMEKMQQAAVVLYLYDLTEMTPESAITEAEKLAKKLDENTTVIPVGNKADLSGSSPLPDPAKMHPIISAADGRGLDLLTQLLISEVAHDGADSYDTVITNARHLEALQGADQALAKAAQNLGEGVSSDFVALDIRQAIHHLGEITGEITTDDLLGNIFSKFCIGK